MTTTTCRSDAPGRGGGARRNRAPFPFLGVIVSQVAMRPYLKSAVSAATAGLIVGAPLFAQDTTAAKPQTQQDTSGKLQTQQDTSGKPQTHTVVKGDNLWTLSQKYLGNPFLWPELYRLNRDVVEDPHWIYPGEIIRLRSADVTVAVVPEKTDSLPGGKLPAMTTDSTLPTQPPVAAPPIPQAPPVPSGPEELQSN